MKFTYKNLKKEQIFINCKTAELFTVLFDKKIIARNEPDYVFEVDETHQDILDDINHGIKEDQISHVGAV